MLVMASTSTRTATISQQAAEFLLPAHCHRIAGHPLILLPPILILILQAALLLHTPRNDHWLLRDHARIPRAILLIPLIVSTMHTAFAHYFAHPPGTYCDDVEDPTTLPNLNNSTLGVMGAFAIGKGIQLALLKIPPRLAFSDRASENGTLNGDHDKDATKDDAPKRRPPQPWFFPHTWIPLCVDLIFNFIGTGWEDGPPSKAGYATAIPPSKRFDRSGRRFLFTRLALASMCAITVAITIFTVSQPRVLAAFDLPVGSNSFQAEPYAHSRFVTGFVRGILAMLYAAAGVAWLHSGLCCLYSVVHFLLDPRARIYWDLLPFGSPFKATSLHAMWGKQWHGMMRRVWQFLAYHPTYRLCRHTLKMSPSISSAIALLALFGLSGLFHEIGQFNLRQGIDGIAKPLPPNYSYTLKMPPALPQCAPLHPRRQGFGADKYANMQFFLAQAVGLILERTYLRITGKRIRGPPGWLWTFGWLLYWSGGLFKTWADHGWMDAFVWPRRLAPFIFDVSAILVAPLFRIADILGHWLS